MSVRGAAADDLIFYVNGRKVSVARRECGERVAADPKVTLRSVGMDLVSSDLTECSHKLPEALVPISLLIGSESTPTYYYALLLTASAVRRGEAAEEDKYNILF